MLEAEGAETAETLRLFVGARGMGFDTFRLGTFVPNLSSVAFSRACSSCRSLKPLVFDELALTTRGGAGDLAFREMELALAKGEGEEGPATLARLRVLVERAREGRPEGDLVMPVWVRLTDGEAAMLEMD